MAKKFDLKATALGRVTESSADEIMIGALTGKPSNDKVVVKLPLSLLDPYPLQEEAYPVQDGDYEAKAESMSKLGQLDPIHVVRAARGRYQILAGHRLPQKLRSDVPSPRVSCYLPLHGCLFLSM